MRGFKQNERGSALMVVVVVLTTVSMLSLSLLISVTSANSERKGSQRSLSVRYVCEAAIAQAIQSLSSGGDGVIGTEGNPIDYGNAQFYVESVNEGGGEFTLTATGIENGVTSRIAVTVEQGEEAFYRWAAFGSDGVTMDSNAATDSYLSSLGPYTDQNTNGNGADEYARENGDAGSNADITLSANTIIHGDATAGPASTTTLIGANTAVTGSTTPATDIVTLDALVFPPGSASSSLSVTGSQTLGTGTHHFTSLYLDGSSKLVVTGPAIIVVDDMEIRSNSALYMDTTAGPVEIWVHDDFILNSNAIMAPLNSDPSDLSLYLESDNIIDPDSSVELALVEFESNAAIYGTIYAPNALINIDSNFELFGSVIARQVHLDSNSFVHFDESLLTVAGGGDTPFSVLCWREVAIQ